MKSKSLLLFSTLALILIFANANKSYSQKKKQNKELKSKPIKKVESAQSDTILFSKTAEMLNEDKYWGIIEKSLKNSKNQYSQAKFLEKEIKKLSPKEIVGFKLRTDNLIYNSYSSDLWCAASILNLGCTDDGFEYFRYWLVSRGKKTFYQAIKEPDSLISEIKHNNDLYEFEDFFEIATNTFNTITDKEINDFIDYDIFSTHDGKYPQLNFTWDEDQPETMIKICPKIYGKINKD
jgi:hypothetical protein